MARVMRIPLDPESRVVEQHFAVVYAPRRQRDRSPETCIETVDSEEVARSAADPAGKWFPAVGIVQPTQ